MKKLRGLVAPVLLLAVACSSEATKPQQVQAPQQQSQPAPTTETTKPPPPLGSREHPCSYIGNAPVQDGCSGTGVPVYLRTPEEGKLVLCVPYAPWPQYTDGGVSITCNWDAYNKSLVPEPPATTTSTEPTTTTTEEKKWSGYSPWLSQPP